MAISRKRLREDFASAGAPSELISLEAAVNGRTIALKNGAVCSFLKIDGIDPECFTAEALDTLVARVERSQRALGDECTVYRYLVKRPCGALPINDYENPLVQEAALRRRSFLEGKGLFRIDLYCAVVYSDTRSRRSRRQSFGHDLLKACQRALSSEAQNRKLGHELEAACQTLANRVDRWVAELKDTLPMAVLSVEEAFSFVYSLVNYAPHKQATCRLRGPHRLDRQIGDSTIECDREYLQMDGHFVRLLTLKELPAHTWANLLDGLQHIPCPFIVSTQWIPVSHEQARKRVNAARRHYHNLIRKLTSYFESAEGAKDALTDPAAQSMVTHFGEALKEIEVNGRHFGFLSLTIVLHAEDLATLRKSVTEFHKACAAVDIVLMEERANQLNAWAAILPGNSAFDLRGQWMLNTNAGDFATLYAPKQGELTNTTLGRECLAMLETNSQTLYGLNFHSGDIPHWFVSGKTGSGKSFLVSSLVDQAQKYNPFTLICDIGGSYESVTRSYGGTYASVNLEHPKFRINPFSLPLSPERLRFQLSLIRVLTERGDFRLTATDQRDLHEQIGNLYAINPSRRTLSTLANIVPRHIRDQLSPWTRGGPYGELFDNEEDNLTFAQFQTLDFEGADKSPEALQALLFYILYRANDTIYDPEQATRFKLVVVDEAWRLFQHAAIRQYIQEALKTWRRKNAAMVLATQSGADLLQADMLRVVAECCATKVFLANPDMDVEACREMFNLNSREAQLIQTLIPKRQMLIKRPDGSKVLNLTVDPKSYWLYTNNPFDNQKKRQVFAQLGFEQGLNELTRRPE